LRFEAVADSGHPIVVDSTGRPDHAGSSPVELLLISVAGCTAMDVISILEKMREPVSGLEVEIRGDRSPSHPKYFTSLALTYRVRGHELSREKVERAVELSRSVYCSVLATLRPDSQVTSVVEISEA
jgi:putative redox protein